MDFITHLWLPIAVCGVALFFCSFLAWAISPHHRGDFQKLPDEDGVRNAVKAANVSPGVYMFPHASDHKDGKEDMKAKFASGPMGLVTVMTMPNMGKNMALTCMVFMVVSAMIGYLLWGLLPVGAGFLPVFKAAGTAGVIAYSFSFLPNAIWFQHGLRATLLCVLDGIVYGMVTGLIFAFMWPGK